MGWAQNMIKGEEKYFKNHTITEFLIRMNRPAWVQKSNGFYLSLFAKIGLTNLKTRYQYLADQVPEITQTDAEFKVEVPLLEVVERVPQMIWIY